MMAVIQSFPSPLGDKFQHDLKDIRYRFSGFRPLTGLNFNIMKKFLMFLVMVSAPSRG